MRTLPQISQVGANRLSDKRPALQVHAYHDAFDQIYTTDAMFVCYYVDGIKGCDYRLNLPILPDIKAAGGEVLMDMLVFDYDNEPKQPWTPELWDEFLGKMAKLEDVFAPASQWTTFYTTRNGARFVYAMDYPMTVDRAMDYYRGLLGLWKQAGLKMDDACAQWNRCFRLPKVWRGDRSTYDDPFFQLQHNNPVSLLRWSDLPAVVAKKPTIAPIEIDAERPEDPEILLYTKNPKGLQTETDWLKRAKKRLRGKDCYPCLFENKLIAEPGARDNTLIHMVGEAIGYLITTPGSSPELVYSLFHGPVMQFDEDEDWEGILWSQVLRIWESELVQQRAQEQIEQSKEEAALSVNDQILKTMQSWSDHPALRSEDAHEFAGQNLIAMTSGKHYYIMLPSGYYDSIGVPMSHLPTRIREQGMHTVMPVEVPKDEGGMKQVSPATLLLYHGTSIYGVEASLAGSGNSIRGLGTKRPILSLKLPGRRTDLEPERNKKVEQWLQLLGGDQYEKLCEWIAQALAFEEGPICALSLVGPPACGKKLLVRGLAECLEVPKVAGAQDAFGKFRSLLLQTPLININEGLPTKNEIGVEAIPDIFRQLISGDPIQVNEKYKDPVTLSSCARMIITANNYEVVLGLTGDRDLSPEDRDALTERLFHITATSEAQFWLQSRGGIQYTGKTPYRWIAEDGGGDSDYIVAKHFLYLYENRQPPAGQRFLVTGSIPRDLMRRLSTGSGIFPAVIETLIRMVEAYNHVPIPGMAITNEGDIEVTTSAVVDYFRTHLDKKVKRELSTKLVHNVFDSLRKPNSPDGLRTLNVKGADKVRKRWTRINTDILLAEAVDNGYEHEYLQKIAGAQADKVTSNE